MEVDAPPEKFDATICVNSNQNIGIENIMLNIPNNDQININNRSQLNVSPIVHNLNTPILSAPVDSGHTVSSIVSVLNALAEPFHPKFPP